MMVKLQKVFLILLCLFFSFFWSLCLFQYWSSDFGFYYLVSNSLSDNNNLYKDIFDHKGPIYYLFIKTVSYFIGYGVYQAYITLSITVFLFSSALLLIAKNKYFINLIILLFIIFSLLHTQNLNISIQLFQSTFIILSFFYLYEFIENKFHFKLHLSYLLIIIAVFTRIDSIIYLPVFFLAPLIIYKDNYYKILFSYLCLMLYFSLIFLFLSLFFNFSFNDYFETNIKFNFFYSWAALREPFIRIFNSPAHIYFLLFTGVIYLFVEIANTILKLRQPSLKDLFKRVNFDLLSSLIIILIGSFFWLYTGSDKNYHVFIILTPLLFIITKYYKFLYLPQIKIYFFLLIGFFFSLITIYPEQKNVIVNNCIIDFKNCPNLINTQSIISDLENYDNSFFIGGDSWSYIINNKKINYSINNFPFYIKQIKNGKIMDVYSRNHFLNTHNSIITKPNGYVFWIKKSIYDLELNDFYFQKSKYLIEIIKLSSIVEEQGNYYKLVITK